MSGWVAPMRWTEDLQHLGERPDSPNAQDSEVKQVTFWGQTHWTQE